MYLELRHIASSLPQLQVAEATSKVASYANQAPSGHKTQLTAEITQPSPLVMQKIY